MQIMTTGAGDRMTFSMRVGGPEGGDAEVGSLPVSVSGEDLAGVVILTSKGATVSGRLSFEGGTKPADLAGFRITSSGIDSDSTGMLGMGGGAGTVKGDGTFELRGLTGTRLIRAVGLPPGWMLKSVLVNGADVTDSGVEFKPGEAVAGLEVVLTSKVTDVSGTVKGSNGQPVRDYTLVVFSDQPERWAVPFSRHVASAPSESGRALRAQEPAGRRLLRDRGRVHRAGRVGRPRGARAPQSQGDEVQPRRRGIEDARAHLAVKWATNLAPYAAGLLLKQLRCLIALFLVWLRPLHPRIRVRNQENHHESGRTTPTC